MPERDFMLKALRPEELEQGMLVAAPVFSGISREEILGPGTTLSDELIQRIANQNVKAVLISFGDEDEREQEMIERNLIEEEGSFTLRIDSVKAKEVHALVIERTTKVFEEIRNNERVDVPVMKELANSLVSEVLGNPQAFSNLSAIRTKDEYTYAHSVDVGVLAIIMGKEMGLSEEELRLITLGGLLHDIGKMRLPFELLNKEGVYTKDERDLMKSHTVKGYKMLVKQNVDARVADIALHHHEWVDGKGYPDSITGDSLDTFSKIVSICDVYNVLTMQKMYKPAIPPYKSMQILAGEVNTHFDKEIAKVFQQVIGVYPNGTMVVLSDGIACRVIDQNPDFPIRPVLQVFMDEGGFAKREIELIDLSIRKDLYIKEVLYKRER